MNNSITGERIKELRLEYNLSQAKLGEILMVSQDTISLWEKNKALPNAEYIISMCKFFDVSADYLLGLSEA